MTPRKAELDPLVYVAVQNIRRDGLFVHGAKANVTFHVYGHEYTTFMEVFILDNPRVRLTYCPTENTERQQTIRLVQTSCNFGGFRWWFSCPGCQARVAKLYRLGDYGCRKCHNLTYRSRNRNKASALYPAQRELDKQERAEYLAKAMRTRFYRGQPTKRYLKVTELLGENELLCTSKH